MRISTQTIQTISTIGLGQCQATVATIGGCGVRALANALALYPAALLPGNTPNGLNWFANISKLSWDDGLLGWMRQVVAMLRRLFSALGDMLRRWLPELDLSVSERTGHTGAAPANG